MYVGKGGFWEGRNEDGHQGWFPQNVLKEKTYGKLKLILDIIFLFSLTKTMMMSLCLRTLNNTKTFHRLIQTLGNHDHCNTVIYFYYRSGIKTVAIHRGEKGFGFAMRGIKGMLNLSLYDVCDFLLAVNVAKFKPSPNVPALQYVARVDKNGAAENAGLEKGDFIIEVSKVL